MPPTPSADPAAPGPAAWHVTPPVGWLNDPNGLVHDGERWHAYFQHHPHSDLWGPMHWGHATSADGLHWQHHPVVLAPDHLGTIFSGSIVVDDEGVAGEGRGAWLAFFTHHGDGVQHQSLAVSRDGGRTFTPHAGNPIIEGSGPDFRDPKVCRLPDGRWHMVTTLGDRLACFESADLLHWEPSAELRVEVGGGSGTWECPDLVALPGGRWWLVLSLSTGGPHGHSATVRVPVARSGRTWEQVGPAALVDHGPDHYAFQTFHRAPAGALVGMAWMNSWRYAWQLPSNGTRGRLTVPRRVEPTADGSWRQWPAPHPPPTDEAAGRWIAADGDVSVVIEGQAGLVRAGVADGVAFVERTGLAVDGYAEQYRAPAGRGRSVVIVDAGSVEVFAADGSVTLSAQVFAGPQVDVRVDRRPPSTG